MARPPAARTGAACYTLRVLRCERSKAARETRDYAARLDSALRQAGAPVAEQVEDHAPTRFRHDAELLHLVALGMEGERRALEALDEPTLAALLPRVRMVVLEVWDPIGKGEHSLRKVAMHALKGGAPACVVPRVAPEPEAWGAWMEGFYRALSEGKDPRQAVKAADTLAQVRAGVSAPFSLVRPRGWQGLDQPLVRRAWRPARWPEPAPEASRLLQAMFSAVRRRRCGYVGVEQLVEALRGEEALHPGVAPLLRHVGPHRAALRRSWEELVPAGGCGPDWRGTPRLQELGERLLPDFGADELLDALKDACDALLIGLSEDEVDPETLPTLTPAQGLEVVGGPEDGRQLVLDPGERLGRAMPGEPAEHVLYGESFLTDLRLSRVHLEWQSDGRVLLPRTATLLSRGERSFVGPGRVELFAEDVLQLTRATRLRGLT